MQTTVYVRLLDEGVPVFRPAVAVRQADGMFLLSAPLEGAHENEVWEFEPGTRIVAAAQYLDGDYVLVAINRA